MITYQIIKLKIIPLVMATRSKLVGKIYIYICMYIYIIYIYILYIIYTILLYINIILLYIIYIIYVSYVIYIQKL